MLSLAACGSPQWRVFQKKIDPEMSATPPAQVEGQKRAAAYIRERTAPPVSDPVQAVSDVHAVAENLSASLGEPEHPVKSDDREIVLSSLRDGLRDKEKQLDAWKAFARKYADKPIEGTGINLAGPAGLIGLVGIAAACVLVPGLGWAVLRLVPVLWSGLARAAGALESAAQKAPEVIAEVKKSLPQKEKDPVRKLIRLAKSRLAAANA
jgi:hypothetical protein